MKYLIYARISVRGESHLKVADTSIPMQIDKCQQYIKHSDGGEVVEIIQDEFISGGTIERPGMQKIINDIDSGTAKWDCIIVYKLDRLSRSVKDSIHLFEKIYKSGKSLISVSERLDFSSPLTRANIMLFCVMSQCYREIAVENVTEKMSFMAKLGKFVVGRAPIGYMRIKDKENNEKKNILIIDPRKADIVRDIFNRYSKGESIMTIIKSYPEIKSTSTLCRILQNKHYIGRIFYRGADYKGLHEPIISEDLFNIVQQRLPKKRKASRPNARKYPSFLTDVLFCHCGRALAPSSGYGKMDKKYHYYKCTDHIKCKTSISAPLIEKAVMDILLNAPVKEDEVKYLIQKANEDRKRFLDQNEPELKQNMKAIMEVKKKKQNIENMFIDGMIDQDNKVEMNGKLVEFRNELKRLEERNKEINEAVKPYMEEYDFADIFKSLKEFSDVLRKTDRIEVLQSFIKSRVTRIELARNRVDFQVRLRAFPDLGLIPVWWRRREPHLKLHKSL